MYNVESRNYNLDQKSRIKETYVRSITNDKLFPGGAQIIDSLLLPQLALLEKLSVTDNAAFLRHSKKLYDSIFSSLQKGSNMDSLLRSIKERNNIKTPLEYALIIQSIELAFKPNQYITFFNGTDTSVSASVPIVENFGAKISGRLTKLNPDNEISGLTVSSPLGHSYRIRFALHCESHDRLNQIILGMLPTILVSAFSILAVLIIFVITLINWQKQKKISEAKSDFINTITHEFQTPLSAIMIANKTIQNENQALNNERLSFLNGVIKRQTERLNILIKQVAGSNTDHGIALRLASYNVNEVLADRVLLDKMYFVSIIINLLDNAVKYNHKPAKELHLSTFNINEKLLRLSIRDNGDGMSEKVRKNMFTRFYRDPSLTRTNEPGLGLGLYFTQQSLKAHKWKYEVRSKEGIGTEFIIYIPLASMEGHTLETERLQTNHA
jgi:two-component system phosphate regulon sensor histidine kinase PhoR